MLNSVASLREWFSQKDDCDELPHIQIMVNMLFDLVSKKGSKLRDFADILSLYSSHKSFHHEEPQDGHYPNHGYRS